MLIDDPRRLRSLCVEQLRREPNQTFRPADIILKEISARMDRMPEWKRHNFSLRYFEVDRDPLEKALVLKKEDERLYLYLKQRSEEHTSELQSLMRISYAVFCLKKKKKNKKQK